MPVVILIMGLPGSGKTTLSIELMKLMDDTEWFNADQVRAAYNDWDFSFDGRVRQARRMHDYAKSSKAKYCILDFVCPLKEMREMINPDVLVWIDTDNQSTYSDTNQIFMKPLEFTFRITERNAPKWSKKIFNYLLKKEKK
ncbi:adenylyl-sulfate kinase [bacterium]|nr:adenylyl-sulfate kinase [bacterium]